MKQDPQYLEKVFNAIGGNEKGYNYGSFVERMSSDSEYNQKVFDAIGGNEKGYNYDSFTTRTGLVKKKDGDSPSAIPSTGSMTIDFEASDGIEKEEEKATYQLGTGVQPTETPQFMEGVVERRPEPQPDFGRFMVTPEEAKKQERIQRTPALKNLFSDYTQEDIEEVLEQPEKRYLGGKEILTGGRARTKDGSVVSFDDLKEKEFSVEDFATIPEKEWATLLLEGDDKAIQYTEDLVDATGEVSLEAADWIMLGYLGLPKAAKQRKINNEAQKAAAISSAVADILNEKIAKDEADILKEQRAVSEYANEQLTINEIYYKDGRIDEETYNKNKANINKYLNEFISEERKASLRAKKNTSLALAAINAEYDARTQGKSSIGKGLLNGFLSGMSGAATGIGLGGYDAAEILRNITTRIENLFLDKPREYGFSMSKEDFARRFVELDAGNLGYLLHEDEDIKKRLGGTGGFLYEAAVGTAGSIPLIIVPGGVGIFAQAYGEGYVSALDAGLDGNFATLYGYTIGAIQAKLERYGFRNLMANKSFVGAIANRSIRQVSGAKKNVIQALDKVINNEIKSKRYTLAKASTSAFLSEFETGGLQYLSDQGLKALANEIAGREAFKDLDFSASSILRNAALEGVGGLYMSTMNIFSTRERHNWSGFSNEQIEMFRSALTDPKSKLSQQYLNYLNQQFQLGNMSEAEYGRRLNNFRNARNVFSQVPSEYSNEDAGKAADLLQSKRAIEDKLKRYPEMPLKKDRAALARINEELDKIDAKYPASEGTQEATDLEQPVPEQPVAEETATEEEITVAEDEVSELEEELQRAEDEGTLEDNLGQKAYRNGEEGMIMIDPENENTIVFETNDMRYELGNKDEVGGNLIADSGLTLMPPEGVDVVTQEEGTAETRDLPTDVYSIDGKQYTIIGRRRDKKGKAVVRVKEVDTGLERRFVGEKAERILKDQALREGARPAPEPTLKEEGKERVAVEPTVETKEQRKQRIAEEKAKLDAQTEQELNEKVAESEKAVADFENELLEEMASKEKNKDLVQVKENVFQVTKKKDGTFAVSKMRTDGKLIRATNPTEVRQAIAQFKRQKTNAEKKAFREAEELIKEARAEEQDKILEWLDKAISNTSSQGRAFDATIGLPLAVINSSLKILRAAYKAGKTLSQAIQDAINHIKQQGYAINEREYKRYILNKLKQDADAFQEQEARDIPDAERAEGVQEVEEEVRESDKKKEEALIEEQRDQELSLYSDKQLDVPVGDTGLTLRETINQYYDDLLGKTDAQNIPLNGLNGIISMIDNAIPKNRISAAMRPLYDFIAGLKGAKRKAVKEIIEDIKSQASNIDDVNDIIDSRKELSNAEKANLKELLQNMPEAEAAMFAPSDQYVNDAQAVGASPFGFKEMYEEFRSKFGLSKKKAKFAAIIADRMITTMAKRAGITKQQMYKNIIYGDIEMFEQMRDKGNPLYQLVYHAGDGALSKWDESKFKGGSRATHGWGMYFSSSKSKAQDYGRIKAVFDSADFNFFNLDEQVTKEKIKELAIAIGGEKAFKDLGKGTVIIDTGNVTYDSLLNNLLKEEGKDFDTARKNVLNNYANNLDRSYAMMLKEAGYDAVSQSDGYYFVVINGDKYNQVYDRYKEIGEMPTGIKFQSQDASLIERVFHGTSKDKEFKKFRNNSGKGIFVTTSPETASQYAMENDSMRLGDYNPVTGKFKEINTASRIIPMNLNLSGANTYTLTESDLKFLNSKPNYGSLQKELHNRVREEGYDVVDYGDGNYAILTEGRLTSMLTNEVLFQDARGAMMAVDDARFIIFALTDPNVSTPLHELAHVYEHYLTDAERKKILDWAGHNTWTVETSEKFARGFERFLAEPGGAPKSVQRYFKSFKKWLSEIYESLIGSLSGSDIDVGLNEDMARIYTEMLGEDFTVEQEAHYAVKRAAPLLFDAEGNPVTEATFGTVSQRFWGSLRRGRLGRSWQAWSRSTSNTLNGESGFLSLFRQRMTQLSTMTKMMDGVNKSNFFTKNIYKPLLNATETYMKGKRSQIRKLDKLANSIKGVKNGFNGIIKLLSVNDMTIVSYDISKGAKSGIRRNTFSADQLARIYALSKNKDQRRILKKMGFNNAAMAEIEGQLGPEVTEFVDKVVEYLSSDYFGTVNSVYSSITGESLNQIENYFPTKKLTSKSITGQDIKQTFKDDFDGMWQSALQDRVDKNTDIDIDQSFTGVLMNHFDSMEHFKAFAVEVDNISKILDSETVKVWMKGLGINNILRTSLIDTVNPTANQEVTDRIFPRAYRNLISSILMMPVQIPRQMASFLTAFSKYKGGFLEFMYDYAAVISKLPKWLKFLRENSAMFDERMRNNLSGNGYLIETGGRKFVPSSLATKGKRRYYVRAGQRRVLAAAGIFTTVGDALGIMGYAANMRKNLREGMSLDQAISEFNEYDATQQSQTTLNKVSYQKSGNVLIRTSMAFSSSIISLMNVGFRGANGIWNSVKNGDVNPNKWRKEDIRSLFIGYLGSNFLYALVNQFSKLVAGDEEDRKDAMFELAYGLSGLNSAERIPILGEAINQIKNITKASLGIGEYNPYRTGGQINHMAEWVRRIKKASKDDKYLELIKVAIAMNFGVNVDPAIGAYNFVETTFGKGGVKSLDDAMNVLRDEDFYEAIGLSKSYRPKLSKGESPSYEESGMNEDLYDLIYGD